MYYKFGIDVSQQFHIADISSYLSMDPTYGTGGGSLTLKSFGDWAELGFLKTIKSFEYDFK